MFKSVVVAALVASAAAFAPVPSTVGVRTALSAEWTPADGSEWKETNFEADMQKLEKEAEERLDAKIKELEANIATVGK